MLKDKDAMKACDLIEHLHLGGTTNTENHHKHPFSLTQTVLKQTADLINPI